MNSICILLTDHISLNEQILIKSLIKLKKNKLNKIYFVGDKTKYKKFYIKIQKVKKIKFINILIKKKNYFNYLKEILSIGIDLYRKKKIKFLINMPLDKKKFFNTKYPGFTEFFSYEFDKKNNQNMLMFSKKISVCPLTTHINLKKVDEKINKKILINCINNIFFFFTKIIKKKINIIVLGLNPHAGKDMTNANNKDKKIIKPVIKYFKKKGLNIDGPLSADTAFCNYKNKVYLGMYHDQVLTPFKIINNINGINITIGKKLIRLTPGHGTGNSKKINSKLISNNSFLECIKFCENY